MSVRCLLIGYDASAAARTAVATAAELFPGAAAVIVFVDQALALPATPVADAAALPLTPMAPPDAQEQLRQHDAARQVVDEGVELAQRAGLRPAPAAREAGSTGDVARALLGEAEEHAAEVLVVGSSRKSLLDRTLSGSVLATLTRESDRPLLVVPARE